MEITPRWDETGPVWSRRLLGHNTVWCRGGLGVWDEANARFVPAVLDAVRALRPGVLRFPGGTRAMRWRFDETLGPRDARRPQCDTFRGVRDATGYGLAEGLAFAEALGAEVALVAPWVDGSPEATAALVAYACGDPGATLALGVDEHGRDWGTAGAWAARRVADGHEAPYPVALLEVGNEPYLGLPVGPERSCERDAPFRQCERWVAGRAVPTTAVLYAAALRATSALVREIAPGLRIGAAAAGGLFEHEDARREVGAADAEAGTHDPWNLRLLADAGDAFDLWVAHPYVIEPTDARLRLGARVAKCLGELRALDARPVAVTEYGFMFGGDTVRNAVASVDAVRAAAEHGAAFALRHLLIEDDPGGPFATSALVLGPDRRRTPAWHATRLLAETLGGRRVPVEGALACRDGGRLGVVTACADGVALSVRLPPGRWRAAVTTATGADLDAREVTVASWERAVEGALDLDAAGPAVLAASFTPA